MTAANADEIAKFSALAKEWWDPDGPLKGLHLLQPARLQFIRSRALGHFLRDPKQRRPFVGLSGLDFGCGAGLVTEPLARLGFAMTGADGSGEAIAAAQAHAQPQGLAIDYRETTEHVLTAEGRQFDLLTALELVEHVDDRRGFLITLGHLVKPGGLLILSTLNRTPQAYALGIVAAERVLGWAPPGAHEHAKFVTPEELRADVEAAGLTPEGPFGLAFDLLSRDFKLSSDASINYFLCGRKPSS
jgi:2-polyprenyl-6-hydroxyphenyl methylase/3-demethylubiquinone-9 3-methyltransferase